MIRDVLQILGGWTALDTWIVITAATAAMACAIPGVFLLIRQQSMLGDALSHTALPGIAIGFLAALWLREINWISAEQYVVWRHALLFGGAALVGVLSAVLTEAVHKLGRIEPNAALGVVFTSLFALGLILVRLFADKVDLDPDCVLYGMVETSSMDRVTSWNIPRAALINGVVFLLNLLFVVLLFKELRVASFDPSLATSMGINAQVLHYVLTSVTAVTLVAAFESVGSILVIAMLVTPAATAHLLTDRLWKLLVLAVIIGALSAVVGHVLAIVLPPLLFQRLGYGTDVSASTAGMMAVGGGLLFIAAALFGPRYGIVSRLLLRMQMSLQVISEDILGVLYRHEEQPSEAPYAGPDRSFLRQLAIRWLQWKGELARTGAGVTLTELGRNRAERLVRSHRLWEAYMARHMPLPEDHLHATAERVEHYIDERMRADMDAELAGPEQDPHGRTIPVEKDPSK